MLVNKRCTYCGKKFQAHTTKTRFCSHTCNQKDYKARIKKKRLESLSKDNTTNAISFREQIEINKAKEFLSISDCALLLNVSRSTIKRLITKGDLSSFNVLSRVLIRKQDLEEFCKSELSVLKKQEKKREQKPISNQAKHFNKENYYYMSEITNYFNVSVKSVGRHLKVKGINKIKKGRFVYVLKTDIKKLYGVPLKTVTDD